MSPKRSEMRPPRVGTLHIDLVYHARSAHLPACMQEVYGQPLEALEAEWRAALR